MFKIKHPKSYHVLCSYFTETIKLHYFTVIRLRGKNYYDHKVHNDNNHMLHYCNIKYCNMK